MAIQLYVLEPGMWENDNGPADWWAVVGETGIVAYAATEELAYATLARCEAEIRAINPEVR